MSRLNRPIAVEPNSPGGVIAILQNPRNIDAVSNAIVARVRSTHGLVVLPQRRTAVRAALINQWSYWNDERGNMPAANAPRTTREVVRYINDRAIVAAASAIAENYRARQQFLADQQAHLQVMEHPHFDSVAGLAMTENRDIGI